MIDRYLIRYFLAVVDHGNFTRAATHCRVSQPTLSAGISKLEGLLNRILFERSNRRVQLTSAGARFTDHARKIEAGFIEAALAVSTEAPVKTLRLGLLSSLPARWCEEVAAAAAKSGERVEIVDGPPKDLRSLLDRGRIDAAVTTLGTRELLSHAETFWTEPYMLVVGASHPLAGRDTVAAEELAAETMLIRRGCEALSEVSRYFTGRGIRPFMAARTVSEERVVSYVRARLGITVMPRCFGAVGVSMMSLSGFSLTRAVGLIKRDDGASCRDASALSGISTTLRGLVVQPTEEGSVSRSM